MFEEIGALNLARFQFAFTVSAHIIFPALIICWVLPYCSRKTKKAAIGRL